MLQFKTVRWKNLLSTGNGFTEIDLERSKTTLIVGKNGNGKSTMLEAITFALFGKPYRNVKLDQLVNSINERGLICEIEFTTRGRYYKVSRGLKPSYLEIYEDGEQLNQEAKLKDTQATLDKIIGMNMKTFKQVVVLSSSSFTPFMQLRASERRMVIEELLDIKMFSSMNLLLNSKLSVLKESRRTTELDFDKTSHELEVLSSYVGERREDIQRSIDVTKNKIKEAEETNEDNGAKIEKYNSMLEKLYSEREKYASWEPRLEKLKQVVTKATTQRSSILQTHNFLSQNDSCPTCLQNITDEFREEKKEEFDQKIKTLEEGLRKVDNEMANANRMVESVHKIDNKISEINNEITRINSIIHTVNSSIRNYQREVEELNEELGSFDDNNQKRVVELETIISQLEKELKRISKEMDDYKIISSLLKDSGIKTQIVKRYLPVMNSSINRYLEVLDFYVNFTLDENFCEVIKSRHRDSFSYDSFSEGEKMRIDLALLFAWREIARMKNSVKTNLLILDEVFESSLDASGTEDFMKLLNMENETNTFIISHKGDIIMEQFQNVIEFEKINGFSQIKLQ